MSEYQALENTILSEFKNENLPIDLENPNKIEDLVDQFNIYWKNYQDKWTPNYWEIYESLHNNEKNENEISDIYTDKDEEDKIIFCNDSIIADNINLNLKENNNNNIYLCNDNNNKDFSPFMIINNNNNNFNSKDNQKFNSTNHQTKTLINLQEIDDELEKINDVSMIKEKKQQDKKRNCFDCIVF